jgi:hypothetical protein
MNDTKYCSNCTHEIHGYCKITGKFLLSKSCEDWEQNPDTELDMLREENAELKKKVGWLQAQVAVMRQALESALYDLSTSHNLLATDRPDLVNLNNIICRKTTVEPMKTVSGQDIMWMTDNSKGVNAVNNALQTTPDQAAERTQMLVDALDWIIDHSDTGFKYHGINCGEGVGIAIKAKANDALAKWRG